MTKRFSPTRTGVEVSRARRILDILPHEGMTYPQIITALGEGQIALSAVSVAILTLERAGKIQRERIIFEHPRGKYSDYRHAPKVLVKRVG